jgi:hypothetical protein
MHLSEHHLSIQLARYFPDDLMAPLELQKIYSDYIKLQAKKAAKSELQSSTNTNEAVAIVAE